jgi:hypothetical protein
MPNKPEIEERWTINSKELRFTWFARTSNTCCLDLRTLAKPSSVWFAKSASDKVRVRMKTPPSSGRRPARRRDTSSVLAASHVSSRTCISGRAWRYASFMRDKGSQSTVAAAPRREPRTICRAPCCNHSKPSRLLFVATSNTNLVQPNRKMHPKAAKTTCKQIGAVTAEETLWCEILGRYGRENGPRDVVRLGDCLSHIEAL